LNPTGLLMEPAVHSVVEPMRASHFFASSLALALGGFCLSALAPAPAATGHTVPVALDKWSDWWGAFDKARKLGASRETTRLIKSNQEMAIYWIIERSKVFVSGPTAELEEDMSALRRAWREAVGSNFADNVYEYYSLLESMDKAERSKLMKRYTAAGTRYRKNIEKKNPAIYGVLWVEFEAIAKELSRVGDHYYASEAWRFAYLVVS
jgi:hypothetical protein